MRFLLDGTIIHESLSMVIFQVEVATTAAMTGKSCYKGAHIVAGGGSPSPARHTNVDIYLSGQ